MARQLAADRHPIGLLAIIDTGPGRQSLEGSRGPAGALWGFMMNLPRWIHEDLIRASWHEAPAKLRRSTGKLIKHLLRRIGRTAGSSEAATDIFDVNRWTESQQTQVGLNLRALEEFAYRPYPGRLVLFRAKARPLFHAHVRDAGWRSIAQEITIVDLPGNHHTIMRSPHVETLAAALRAALEESYALAQR
jgi:thioesterase domain-containing protein